MFVNNNYHTPNILMSPGLTGRRSPWRRGRMTRQHRHWMQLVHTLWTSHQTGTRRWSYESGNSSKSTACRLQPQTYHNASYSNPCPLQLLPLVAHLITPKFHSVCRSRDLGRWQGLLCPVGHSHRQFHAMRIAVKHKVEQKLSYQDWDMQLCSAPGVDLPSGQCSWWKFWPFQWEVEPAGSHKLHTLWPGTEKPVPPAVEIHSKDDQPYSNEKRDGNCDLQKCIGTVGTHEQLKWVRSKERKLKSAGNSLRPQGNAM